MLAAVGHLPQLPAQRADAVGGLALPGAGLVLDLAAGLADQVARLRLHLLRDVRGLLGRRAGDLTSGVRRGAADVGGLVPGHLPGGRRSATLDGAVGCPAGTPLAVDGG